MMMAYDSNAPPPRNELPPATVSALRDAIARVLPAGGAGTGGGADAGTDPDRQALGTALRAAAREARERAVPPERLLVLLKEAWQAAVARHHGSRADHDRHLQELVTLCIKAYYRSE